MLTETNAQAPSASAAAQPVAEPVAESNTTPSAYAASRPAPAASKFGPSASDKCPRCSKTVYFAEKVRFLSFFVLLDECGSV